MAPSEMLQRPLSIHKAHCGMKPCAVAATLTDVGYAHSAVGDSATGRDLLPRVLTVNEAHCGADGYAVAVTLMNLANWPQRALRIQEAQYGDGHYQVTATLAGLGNAHGALHNPAAKKGALQRAVGLDEATTTARVATRSASPARTSPRRMAT